MTEVEVRLRRKLDRLWELTWKPGFSPEVCRAIIESAYVEEETHDSALD